MMLGSACPQRPSWRVAAQAQHRGSQPIPGSSAPPFRAPIPSDQRVADFRFWHDEKRFRGSGDESLAQHTLLAAGGIRMGGNPKAAAVQGYMGWQVTDRWDILWSTSDGAHKAAPLIKPEAGQLINALPGLESLTRKRNLALTLQAAYGEAAWQFVPRTYSLPSQLLQWRQRLTDEATHLASTAGPSSAAPGTAAEVTSSTNSTTQGGRVADTVAGTGSNSSEEGDGEAEGKQSKGSTSQPAGKAPPAAAAAAEPDGGMGPVTGWWALKTGEHLGQGLQVVPSSRALSALLERNAPHVKQAAAAAAQQPQQQKQQQQQGEEEAGVDPTSDTSPLASSSGRDSTGSNSSGSNGGGSIGSSGGTKQMDDSSTGVRNPPRPFISVQQYITQPLLINSRKFGLRVWVLVLGPKPYRAYVYQQGLVLFSSQQYNPDLSVVHTEGAASQGHLTNAALWGPQQQQQHSSTGNGSSSSSSSLPDPSEQPVWPLQQLFELLGQQQADAVWQQIVNTAGKVVGAAAQPVAEAAQRLQWDGDAAFELLGLDFLLDSSYQPWLLEVNASPSMAWNTPGRPDTTQLMYSIKQQMLTDMFALLRLQDRYPAAVAGARSPSAGAAGVPTLTGKTAAAATGGPVAAVAAGGRQQVPAELGLNPVLLQAASKAYFGSRPQVAEMVAHDAQQLAAATAAAPARGDVAIAVQEVLQQLQQQGGQKQQEDQLQQWELLQQHVKHLVGVECELQSSGGWQPLLLRKGAPQDVLGADGCQLYPSPVDVAVSRWQHLRQEVGVK